VHITCDIKWLNHTFFKRNEIVTIDNGINFNILENLKTKNLKDSNDNESNESNDELVSDTEGKTTNHNNNVTKNKTNRGTTVTRSGRIVKMPARYDEFAKIGIYDYDEEELKMEFIGFTSTKELHVKNYNDAMKTDDREHWSKAIEEEHNRMVESEVWSAVDKGMLNKNDKILTTTWAMKKKPNGKYKARINAHGFKQKDGLHYNSTNTSSPVTNDTTIRVMFTILIQMGWKVYVIDVKGACQ
jgi:Reverse transcriptase (RNA-dependent DNA polymerase)